VNIADTYIRELQSKLGELSIISINEIALEIALVISRGGKIYVCGNGGSASTSDHFVTDLIKLVGVEHKTKLNIQSLVSNTSVITAFGNDYSYSEIFSKQLENICGEEDLLFVISASGNSENIIKAIKIAIAKQIKVIGLVGFNGGSLIKMTKDVIHVKSNDYGVVEDCHLSICHILSRLIAINLREIPNEII